MSSIIWACLDLLTALVAGLIALRIRGRGVPVPQGEILLQHHALGAGGVVDVSGAVRRLPGDVFADLWAVRRDSESQRAE